MLVYCSVVRMGSRFIVIVTEPKHAAYGRHVLHSAAQHTLPGRLAVATAEARGHAWAALPYAECWSAARCLRSGPAVQQLAAPNSNYDTFAIISGTPRHIRRNGWHTLLRESFRWGGGVLRGGLACLTSGVIVSLMAP